MNLQRGCLQRCAPSRRGRLDPRPPRANRRPRPSFAHESTLIVDVRTTALLYLSGVKPYMNSQE